MESRRNQKIYKQFFGLARPKRELFIDEVILDMIYFKKVLALGSDVLVSANDRF